MTWTGNRLDASERPLVERMIDYLGFHHIYIDPGRIPASVEDRDILSASYLSSGCHRGQSRLTLSMARHFPRDAIFVRGFGGEIIRGFYNRHGKSLPYGKGDDALTKCLVECYMTSKNKNVDSGFHKLALSATQEFLSATGLLSVPKSFDILDLYYWEQRMGVWAANMHNEDDVALYSMTGYNSRKVFHAAFGLTAKERFGAKIMTNITGLYDKQLANIGVVS